MYPNLQYSIGKVNVFKKDSRNIYWGYTHIVLIENKHKNAAKDNKSLRTF